MFVLKKTITSLCMPFTGLGFLLGLTVFFLMLWPKKSWGRSLALITFLFFFLFGYGILSEPLLKRLERYYPVMSSDSDFSRFETLVVLGGGVSSDPDFPISSQLTRATLTRVVEAVCIVRKAPHLNLIVSGGKVFDVISEASLMAGLAIDLGVPSEKVILEEKSRDTASQATHLKIRLGNKPFLLLTSAFHMKRSMALFEKQGMHPVAVPVHHMVKTSSQKSPFSWFPSEGHFYQARIYMKEVLALIVIYLKSYLC